MKPELHLFDFDGTITSKDSLLDFGAFVVGSSLSRFYLMLVTPLISLMKVGLVKNVDAKRMFLKLHYNGMSRADLERHASEYLKASISGQLIRPKAMEKILELQDAGHTVCIVSASLDIWLRPFASYFKTDLICSIAAFKDGKYFGELDGKNCNYNEKPRRVKSKYELENFSRVVAYGDSAGDKKMFEMADESFMRPFE